MTSSRRDRPGLIRRRVRAARRRVRRRRTSREAVRWALAAAAQLPDHTHAARLVGLVGPPPGGLPAAATAEVSDALEASDATCLQRCLVLQAWLAAHGRTYEVAIGVRNRDGFEAHAWIPGFHLESEQGSFTEIARVPAPGRGGLRAATS